MATKAAPTTSTGTPTSPAPGPHWRTTMNEQGRRKPRVGITIGDPSGIGPEVVLKTIAEPQVREACVPVVICDAQELSHQARRLDLVCGLPIYNRGEGVPHDADGPVLYNLANVRGPVDMGVESGACGRAAGEYIEAGVELCMRGEVDAISTAPINKKAFFLGGYSYPGHTEFLARLSGVGDDFAMAFVSKSLRVVLLTTHMPLSQAIRKVQKPAIESKIRLTYRELRRFGIDRPRIAVAALNPHGAEGGLFGIEESSEILPAIESCRDRESIDVSGPYSADTIFLRAARGEFDAVISCYHDQGMIPVKCLSFGEAINLTLGLPFIRTSVDHGTAFDIAGKGVAEHTSMVAAVLLAAELAGLNTQGSAVEAG
jgi:4-phospho-D-threonate 3-dehydrogenase / 4-phospho-D-erythronate 3-dehydrogenase